MTPDSVRVRLARVLAIRVTLNDFCPCDTAEPPKLIDLSDEVFAAHGTKASPRPPSCASSREPTDD